MFMWINVHVNLQKQLMLRTRGVGGWGGMLTFMWTCRSSWCYAHEGWGGWGGMLTFMWTCRSSWCYAHAGWGGWGEMLTFMWTCRSRWCYAHAGWGGWGGMLTFMWTCRSSWCYAHAGWGGVGWDVNVHVNLQKRLMLRTPGLGQYICIYIYIYSIYLQTFLGYLYIFSSF